MITSVKLMFFSAVAALFSLTTSLALADADVIFSGGGIIRDESGADAKRITFSANLFAASGGAGTGRLQFHFHNLDDSYGLDRSRFTASDFDEVYFETRYFEDTPYTYVRILARGELNGEAGWSMMVRFADFGVPVRNVALPPNHADAVRIQLFDPADIHIYDTGWAQENWREQGWRTLLDGGNVTVDMRLATTP